MLLRDFIICLLYILNAAYGSTDNTHADSNRFDCHPDLNATETRCHSRRCSWVQANSRDRNKGRCYFPDNYRSYVLNNWTETGYGYEAILVKQLRSPWPNDVQKLKLKVWFETQYRLHFKIVDADHERYEVPIKMPTPPSTKPPITDYQVEYSSSPFGLKVTRKSTGTILFNSIISNAPLIYADQFIQISTILSTPVLYGLGENYGPLEIDASHRRKFVFWARDQFPVMHSNLYGSHPFYINIEEDKRAHGVFLLNSNAMEVEIQPNPALTFRTIGGVLDFYIFTGPSLESVVQQYVQAIGIPTMPPFWALGFQLSRWKYNTIENLRAIIERNKILEIPHEVQWGDIDYMENEKIWTYDKQRFNGLPELVEELHNDTMKYIVIVDPGIADSYPGKYPPFDEGIKKNVFIRDHTSNGYLQGKVWPGTTVYPDFSHPNVTDWWYNDANEFHKVIAYDGLWIDMNEPSNFVTGSTTGCTNNNLDKPPYTPEICDRKLEAKTLCPSAVQYLSTHYNLHSLYGLHNAIATHEALKRVLGKRSLVVSRSTFPSLGKYGQHWTGDVGSYWTDLYFSIPGILSFQFFGIPFVGADVCGFHGNTTEELCVRWTQLGAFYPFMRNHNDGNAIDQDPGVWSPSAQQIMKAAIELRYSLLPFMYTQFYFNQLDGRPVIRPMSFVFPDDDKVYKIDKQFVWGTSLLISPALKKNQTTVTAYLPKGLWYSYQPKLNASDDSGHERLNSTGRNYNLNTPLDKINVHIRGGSIVPWQKSSVRTSRSRKNPINLIVALNETEEAIGHLFWDDGESLDTVAKEYYTFLHFQAKQNSVWSKVERNGYKPSDELKLQSISILGLSKPVTSVKVNNVTVNFRYTDIHQELAFANLNLHLLDEFVISWS